MMNLPMEEDHPHDPVWSGGLGHRDGMVFARFCTTCKHWVELTHPRSSAEMVEEMAQEMVDATVGVGTVHDAPHDDDAR